MKYKHPIHKHPVLFLMGLLMLGSFDAPSSAAPTADVVGQWALVNPLPFFPVHSHLLPTGKMMIWPGDGGVSGDNPWSWDPASENVSSLTKPGYDLFCSGHTFLADGELFVAGGHIANSVGLSRMSKYNSVTDTWSGLPDMNAGRWYPTTTTLPNGDVLVVSGSIDLTLGNNALPQVFEASTGTLRSLTNASLGQDLYPRMMVAPNGKVFDASPSRTTRYLDTAGTGAWSFVANRIGGFRDFGSAVMYAPGKVLVMGGGDPPTNTAEVIDLNQPAPSWRAVGSMQYVRRQVNATQLPDGKVLVTGGTAAPGFNDATGHVDAAELWDPATENWTTLASSSGIPRVYHSTALLLPDGRVLSTGGNGYPDTEIFSPPYLFKGARPTITSAPPSVSYGQSFFIKSPDAIATFKVTMLRLSSVTHAFNMSTYINPLTFSQAAGGLTIIAPPNSRVAPPGHYLLFILNESGVPSVAKVVQLGGDSPPPIFPDVIISSLSYANNIFTSTVKNQGTAATPAGTIIGVGYLVDDVWRTCGVVDGPLAAGSSVTISTSCPAYTIPSGTHTISAYVDDINRFAESDESNNQFSQSITVGPDLPDVIVTSVSYANNIFTSTVKNQGTAATPAGTIIGVGYLVDDVWRTCGVVDGPLAAGSSVTISTSCPAYTIPSGTHTISAYVDDINRFAESDESNNQFSQSITVGAAPPDLPDVIATSVTYANGLFTSTVKNQGTAATPEGTLVGVAYLVDGVKQTCGAVDGPLAAGATATIGSGCKAFIIPTGTHTITVKADDINRFAETDENNNQFSQSITIP
ncbi:putative Galactose oxidase [Candidatus Methylobacter favarea]|uniref:Putative Galactose oxidase n=1 Tax=Candidatus Methylobacter favarea TaxID=2707345 RepID=A0A8S0XGY4_9GAMM|nr:CARDB domain-containing protein [Candidatus Methylobacter favarea]CAA9891409.1 putative Galactose oxidase [Candidatus Methylobacter favarea]